MTEYRKTGSQKYYRPKKENQWQQARPYSVDYKEDFVKPETHGTRVRLGGRTRDMIKSQGCWNEDCVEICGGKEVVVSYSDGSVKDSGTIVRTRRLVCKGVLTLVFTPGVPGDPRSVERQSRTDATLR